MNVAVRELQTLFEVGSLGGLSDGQLLDRFVERREGAVFEEIIRRHGPMVWGVCRRVLRDHHDAEDAFQATFLVLARKASSTREREKLGNWLYGVAYHTAMKARTMRAKRRVREVQVTDMPEPMAVPDDLNDVLAEALDRELNRLPEKYRIPIVLCDLEGSSHKEAASQLGWPIGTVSSRLSRARSMLAKRLARWKMSLSVGSLAVLLAQESASASMPTQLVGSTARAASLFAAGGAATAGVVSAEVVSLTEGVLKTMLLTTLKTATAVLLAVGILGAGGVIYRTQTTGRADAQGERYALALAGEENRPAAPPAGGSGPATPNKPDPSPVNFGISVTPELSDAEFRIDAVKGQQVVPEKEETMEVRKFQQRVLEDANRGNAIRLREANQNAITIHALLEEVDARGNTINAVDVGEGVAVRMLLMGRQQEKTLLSELAESVMKRRAKLVNLPLANDVALRAAVRVLGGKAGKVVVALHLTATPQRGLEVIGVRQEQ